MSRVIVLGSVNTDWVLSVPRIVAPGETLAVTGAALYAGGKGANQAVAARRAGAEVELVAAVGTDAASRQRLEELRAEGVSVDSVRVIDGDGGIAIIQVGPGGENAILIVPGANDRLELAHVERSLTTMLQPGDVLSCVLEVPLETVKAGLRRAGALGARTILNAAPVRSGAVELLRWCDVLVVNEIEAGQLIGAEPVGLAEAAIVARRLRELGASEVVITLGAAGSWCLTTDGSNHVPPHAVPVVDTTGAGDAFVGCLASWLARGAPMPEALRAASIAGALAVTRAGAQPSFPTRATIQAALERDQT